LIVIDREVYALSKRRCAMCIKNSMIAKNYQGRAKWPLERRVAAPNLGLGARPDSNAHFFLRKRAPNNAPPTATAAGIPKPNSGAGPGQWMAHAGPAPHAAVVTRKKETAPTIARISNFSFTALARAEF
jgi:hypothetical protein